MVRLSISLMIGVFLIYSLAHGGVVGDVNGDGKVGLEEAVHALQVTAGIKTNNVNNDNNDRKEWGLGSVIMDYDQDGVYASYYVINCL